MYALVAMVKDKPFSERCPTLPQKTRSPAQEPACKDLGRNGQNPTITPKATYTPAPNRAGSRSNKKHSLPTVLA